jgi:hypothetical protein
MLACHFLFSGCCRLVAGPARVAAWSGISVCNSRYCGNACANARSGGLPGRKMWPFSTVAAGRANAQWSTRTRGAKIAGTGAAAIRKRPARKAARLAPAVIPAGRRGSRRTGNARSGRLAAHPAGRRQAWRLSHRGLPNRCRPNPEHCPSTRQWRARQSGRAPPARPQSMRARRRGGEPGWSFSSAHSTIRPRPIPNDTRHAMTARRCGFAPRQTCSSPIAHRHVTIDCAQCCRHALTYHPVNKTFRITIKLRKRKQTWKPPPQPPD